MKLYMLWDMEGVSGLFRREEAWYWHPGVSPETAEAVARLRAGERPAPYAPALPMTASIRMATLADAEKAAQRPGVRRVDEHTVEAVVERRCDVIKWITGTGLD